MFFDGNDRYAGDRAWREWFRICSVGECPEILAAKLRAQVEAAMRAQLVRYGFSPEDAAADDPVAFFDGYFMLKGSRTKPKPLKSYFAYRITADALSLRDFVCGTLFGSQSGRIHDIVLDWIATLKGWKPRTLRGEDGKRHLVWENAGPEDISQIEIATENDPAASVTAEDYHAAAEKVLECIARQTKVEKQKVALLLYATAQDVPITEAAVLEGLETAKSRAYAVRGKVMEALRRGLTRTEEREDPLFTRMLLEVCEANLPEGFLAKIGDAQ